MQTAAITTNRNNSKILSLLLTNVFSLPKIKRLPLLPSNFDLEEISLNSALGSCFRFYRGAL
jgi:hypothetical protein